MRRRLLQLVLGFVVVGLLLALLSRDAVLKKMQTVKYGEPMAFCVGGIDVVVDERWLVELVVQEGKATSMLFGIFPVPMAWVSPADKGSLVALRELNGGASVSVHKAAFALSSEVLRANCLKNSACSVEKSLLGDGEDVAAVRTGPATWLTYLRRPVMIATHGKSTGPIEGIRATGTCQ